MVVCDPGCAEWAEWFDDCVCSDKDLVSFLFGISSVLFFANCFLPQITLNFMSSSSEGLSAGMIVVWSLGDACNLIGLCLTGAMPTQYMMAILFCMCDGILNFQNIYYNHWRARRTLKSLREPLLQQQADIAQGNSIQTINEDCQSSPHSMLAAETSDECMLPTKQANDETGSTAPSSKYLHSLSAGLMLVGCGVVTLGLPLASTLQMTDSYSARLGFHTGRNSAGHDDFHSGRVLLADAYGSSAASPSKLSVVLGSMLGWIMTCSYVGSRIPQLIKNYRRGMTTGLSLPMFVLLVLGSTTYVASIFFRSTARDFVVPKLPWLLEAMGSAILDFSIVCQVIYYKRKNRHRPEVAALIPAAGAATV